MVCTLTSRAHLNLRVVWMAIAGSILRYLQFMEAYSWRRGHQGEHVEVTPLEAVICFGKIAVTILQSAGCAVLETVIR